MPSCLRRPKRIYFDVNEAIAAARALFFRQGERNLNVYWCAQHQAYHVGHTIFHFGRSKAKR